MFWGTSPAIEDILEANRNQGWPWPRWSIKFECTCGEIIEVTDIDPATVSGAFLDRIVCRECRKVYELIVREKDSDTAPQKATPTLPRTPGTNAPTSKAQAPQATQGPLRANEV